MFSHCYPIYIIFYPIVIIWVYLSHLKIITALAKIPITLKAMDQVVGATAVWLPIREPKGGLKRLRVFVGHSPRWDSYGLFVNYGCCMFLYGCLNGLFHVLSELEGCLHVHFSAINHDVLERFRPAETTNALLARPRSIWIRGSHPFEPRSLSALSTPVDAPSLTE